MSGDLDSFDLYSDSFELDISNGFSFSEKTPATSKPVSQGASRENSKMAKSTISHHTPPWFSQKPPTAGKKTSVHNSVRVERRRKSPIYKMQHLGSGSEGKDDQTPISPVPNGSSLNQASRPLCFKEVAGVVHAIQSASKEFNTSREVRDFAYKEWLAKKREKLQEKGLEKRDLKKVGKCEEKRKRELERMNKWLASKKAGLQARNKQQADRAKREKMEEQEKRAKILEGEMAAMHWRKVNYKQLVKTHRQLKKTEEEEDKKKMEEMEEKEAQSKCTFESWKQQKDLVIKEKFNKMKSQTKELEKRKKEQAQQNEMESQNAYENWKATKDKGIKANKTLYTYKDDLKSVHERAWCPARSMHHSYPQNKENKKSNSSRGQSAMSKPASEVQSPNTVDSYSNASFESDEFEEMIRRSRDSTESSYSSTSPVSTIALTGTYKSIQVCCQTLQYWCTCKDTQ